MVAAATLLLNLACKTSAFPESSPLPPYFISPKILPIDGSDS